MLTTFWLGEIMSAFHSNFYVPYGKICMSQHGFHTLILWSKSFNHLTVLESDIIVLKIRLHFNKVYDLKHFLQLLSNVHCTID